MEMTKHVTQCQLFCFWVFVKIILLLNMDKEKPNFNIWGEISVSELVLEATKVEQKYEQKNHKKNVASRSWRRTTCKLTEK